MKQHVTFYAHTIVLLFYFVFRCLETTCLYNGQKYTVEIINLKSYKVYALYTSCIIRNCFNINDYSNQLIVRNLDKYKCLNVEYVFYKKDTRTWFESFPVLSIKLINWKDTGTYCLYPLSCLWINLCCVTLND